MTYPLTPFAAWEPIWKLDPSFDRIAFDSCVSEFARVAQIRNRAWGHFPLGSLSCLSKGDVTTVMQWLDSIRPFLEQMSAELRGERETSLSHLQKHLALSEARKVYHVARWMRWLELEKVVAHAFHRGSVVAAAVAVRSIVEEAMIQRFLAKAFHRFLADEHVTADAMLITLDVIVDRYIGRSTPLGGNDTTPKGRPGVMRRMQSQPPDWCAEAIGVLSAAYSSLNPLVHPNHLNNQSILEPEKGLGAVTVLLAFSAAYRYATQFSDPFICDVIQAGGIVDTKRGSNIRIGRLPVDDALLNSSDTWKRFRSEWIPRVVGDYESRRAATGTSDTQPAFPKLLLPWHHAWTEGSLLTRVTVDDQTSGKDSLDLRVFGFPYDQRVWDERLTDTGNLEAALALVHQLANCLGRALPDINDVASLSSFGSDVGLPTTKEGWIALALARNAAEWVRELHPTVGRDEFWLARWRLLVTSGHALAIQLSFLKQSLFIEHWAAMALAENPVGTAMFVRALIEVANVSLDQSSRLSSAVSELRAYDIALLDFVGQKGSSAARARQRIERRRKHFEMLHASAFDVVSGQEDGTRVLDDTLGPAGRRISISVLRGVMATKHDELSRVMHGDVHWLDSLVNESVLRNQFLACVAVIGACNPTWPFLTSGAIEEAAELLFAGVTLMGHNGMPFTKRAMAEIPHLPLALNRWLMGIPDGDPEEFLRTIECKNAQQGRAPRVRLQFRLQEALSLSRRGDTEEATKRWHSILSDARDSFTRTETGDERVLLAWICLLAAEQSFNASEFRRSLYLADEGLRRGRDVLLEKGDVDGATVEWAAEIVEALYRLVTRAGGRVGANALLLQRSLQRMTLADGAAYLLIGEEKRGLARLQARMAAAQCANVLGDSALAEALIAESRLIAAEQAAVGGRITAARAVVVLGLSVLTGKLDTCWIAKDYVLDSLKAALADGDYWGQLQQMGLSPFGEVDWDGGSVPLDLAILLCTAWFESGRALQASGDAALAVTVLKSGMEIAKVACERKPVCKKRFLIAERIHLAFALALHASGNTEAGLAALRTAYTTGDGSAPPSVDSSPAHATAAAESRAQFDWVRALLEMPDEGLDQIPDRSLDPFHRAEAILAMLD